VADNNENLDLVGETPFEVKFATQPWHPEKERMKLAYWVLGGIFATFVLTILACFLAKQEYLETSVSFALFEFCRTGLLPIVTLILGYYFSKN